MFSVIKWIKRVSVQYIQNNVQMFVKLYSSQIKTSAINRQLDSESTSIIHFKVSLLITPLLLEIRTQHSTASSQNSLISTCVKVPVTFNLDLSKFPSKKIIKKEALTYSHTFFRTASCFSSMNSVIQFCQFSGTRKLFVQMLLAHWLIITIRLITSSESTIFD